MEQNRAFGKTPISGKIKQTEHARSGLFFQKSPDPFLVPLLWFPFSAEQRSGLGRLRVWGRQAFGLDSVCGRFRRFGRCGRRSRIGRQATAYGFATAGATAGMTSGIISTYVANPNAGLHEYAFSMGLGGLTGGLNPAGSVGGLTLGGIGAGLAYATNNRWQSGYQIGELAGGMLGSGLADRREPVASYGTRRHRRWFRLGHRGYRILAEWRRPGSWRLRPTLAAASGAWRPRDGSSASSREPKSGCPCLMINCRQPQLTQTRGTAELRTQPTTSTVPIAAASRRRRRGHCGPAGTGRSCSVSLGCTRNTPSASMITASARRLLRRSWQAPRAAVFFKSPGRRLAWYVLRSPQMLDSQDTTRYTRTRP